MASSIYQSTGPGRPPPPGAFVPSHPQQIRHPSAAFSTSGHPNYMSGPPPPPPPYPSMLPPRGPFNPSHHSGLLHPYGSGPPAGPISAGVSFGPPGVPQQQGQYTSSHIPSSYASLPHQTLPPPPSSHSVKPPTLSLPPRPQASQATSYVNYQSSLSAPPHGSSSQGNLSSSFAPLNHATYSSGLTHQSHYSNQTNQASHLNILSGQGGSIGAHTSHGPWGSGISGSTAPSLPPPSLQVGKPGVPKGDYSQQKAKNLQPTEGALPTRVSSTGLDGSRVETEEARRERKKRESEKKRLEDKQKDKKISPVAVRRSQPTAVSQFAKPAPGSHRDSRAEKKAVVPPERMENRLKRHSTFLCKIKFRNELPDPASQPKLLQINTDKDQYTKYMVTSLEKNYKHKLCVEPDLGIPLDLLDLSVYNAPQVKQALEPADLELLVDDEVVVKEKTDNIRKKDRPTDKGVAWLVKTTYISPINLDPAKQSLTEKQAKDLREQREGRRDILESLNDREQQIHAIEESFEVSKLRPVHQTKPELEPVEVWPLLPDLDRVGDQFVHVVFDAEPTAESELHSKLEPEVRDEIEGRAILKSFSIPGSESRSEKFVAYMVPKVEELMSDIYENDDEISYTWVREYHWDLRTEDARNTYVFSFGEDAVRYMPLSTKMILQKKKAKDGRGSKDDVDNQFPIPSSISIRRRVLTDEEEEHRILSRQTFIEAYDNVEEEPSPLKRKRSMDSERFSPKHVRTFEEATNREMSDDDDVSD
ncbi:hypothetical protein O6H91_02G146400 [Diphasiastrum complanatum]|uniref:Uncharacterized protein n=1 Tax=Diphasiastrum complanatum TaxID=34168 RepID=A0ACC2EM01_DIPCM|nr:hypothetical protein O6H91_02G146400 [Diphasiastrum complanatum]